jgi:hypothetical protein
MTMSKEQLIEKLKPVCDLLADVDLSMPHLVHRALDQKFPVGGPWFLEVKALVRSGVKDGWLCDRENQGVKFSRIKKAAGEKDLSIDAVHMRSSGGAHTHPNGEVSISFSVEGSPRFDGGGDGWTVYGPRSWHVPTVTGGVMDIVYFLPGGAMLFGDRPK